MHHTSTAVRIAGACLAVALASCLALVALASAQGGSGGPVQSITITAQVAVPP